MSPRTVQSYADNIEAAGRLPVVCSQCVTIESVLHLQSWVRNIPETEWSAGDESEHSWSEYRLSLGELRAAVGEIAVLFALAERSYSVSGWVNRFEYGQWIDRHNDASGDLQCIIPIVVPAPSQGGQLWINSPLQVVPAVGGDAVIFNASAHAHGTSPVLVRGVQRVTVNVRYWFPV